MSFNTHDINRMPIIDRTNYEEYFLMYVDDELTAEEKTAVEQFVRSNPDLQSELELLLSTKLPADVISLSNKDELLADHMQMADVDESLLLYIDGELPAEQKEILKQKIRSNKEVQLQYELLQKAKLDKNEVIPFPYKKALYRTTVSRRMVYQRLRVAAAIVIIAGAGLLYWLQPATTVSAPTIAQHTTKTVEPAHPAAANDTPEPKEDTQQTAMQQKAVNEDKETIVKKTADPVYIPLNEIAAVTHPVQKEEKVQVAVDNIDIPAEIVTNPSVATIPHLSKEKITTPPVTSGTPKTYTITNASYHTTDPGEEVAENNSSSHKAPLKGFFRKATRFIERTTNIHPENEDNELLIGVVAINLK